MTKPPENIRQWRISLRRGKPCVEGNRDDGSMIHVYIINHDVSDALVTCAETAQRYRLI